MRKSLNCLIAGAFKLFQRNANCVTISAILQLNKDELSSGLSNIDLAFGHTQDLAGTQMLRCV